MDSSRSHLRTRRRLLLSAAAAALALVAAGCVAPTTTTTTATTVVPGTTVPVMGGASRLSESQIVSWFNAQDRPTYRAGVGVSTLVRYFVDEGGDEGVRGDLAFVQAIVETGWFSFGGRVPASANNFSGLGATDGTTDYAVFPDARTGVRAQIQHLRAYADATGTAATLHHSLVDPRFDMVSPKGTAPTWNQMGNGSWATDPLYGSKVITWYGKLLAAYGLSLR